MNNTTELLDAVEFATLAHQGQVRGGKGVPYVTHPIDVARRLHNAGFAETDILVAALLHDVAEDTQVPLAEITRRFGYRVSGLVEHLTLPLDARKDRELKQAYQLRKMLDMDTWGRAIKIADKTSNVHDLVADPPKWGVRALRGYSDAARAVVWAATGVKPQANLWQVLVDPKLADLILSFERAYSTAATTYGWNPAEAFPQ
jgi:guanosine-3',5'-bis(diphosphate) 3'-pyrophosphohydrolase